MTGGRKITLPQTVSLTDMEIRLATMVGRSRQRKNEQAEIGNRRVCQVRKDLSMHVEGFAAELAFCKVVGVYPDLDTTPRRGGIDCTLLSGETVDVKTTRYESGCLITPVSKGRLEEHADIAVLVITHKRHRYSVVGWVPMSKLLAPATVRPFGPRGVPTHVVEQGELNTDLRVATTARLSRLPGPGVPPEAVAPTARIVKNSGNGWTSWGYVITYMDGTRIAGNGLKSWDEAWAHARERDPYVRLAP